MKWSFHSIRNGLLIPFPQELNVCITFLQERDASIPFLKEWNASNGCPNWNHALNSSADDGKGTIQSGLWNEIPIDPLSWWICPVEASEHIWICPLQQDKSSRSEDLKGCHPQRLKGIVQIQLGVFSASFHYSHMISLYSEWHFTPLYP